MTIRAWPPLRIIGENATPYLVANLAGYGLFLIGFGLGLFFPQLSAAQLTRLQDDGTAELVQSLITSP